MSKGQAIGSRGHRLATGVSLPPVVTGLGRRSEVRPEFTRSIPDDDGLRRSTQQPRHWNSLRLSRWRLEHGIARTPG